MYRVFMCSFGFGWFLVRICWWFGWFLKLKWKFLVMFKGYYDVLKKYVMYEIYNALNLQ
jgi:hypothetical protein